MRVIQVLPSLAFGDAVGNDTLALKKILKKLGYETAIYAGNIDSRLPVGSAFPIRELKKVNENDIILFHMAIGSELSYWIRKQKCRKIMIYHNITPAHFFAEYDTDSMRLCSQGLNEVKMLKDTFECVYADSDFNKADLERMGYTCPIKVLPILINFEDYKKKPNSKILKQYDDDYINIVFVGRVAPNKKFENLIAAFYYYKKYYNEKARLILVGSYRGMERYYGRLTRYADELGVEDIIFTNHVPFDEILAYYHLADVFLCMSEHEGFCVPLVEAMYFNVPIVAYDKCAIKYTLGGSGFLIDTKDGVEIAGIVNHIIQDKNLKERILHNQQERLQDFDNDVVGRIFIQYLEEFIKM